MRDLLAMKPLLTINKHQQLSELVLELHEIYLKIDIQGLKHV